MQTRLYLCPLWKEGKLEKKKQGEVDEIDVFGNGLKPKDQFSNQGLKLSVSWIL